MRLRHHIAAAALCSAALGCTTSAPAPSEPAGDLAYVSHMKLSRTFGEVGKPFQAEIAFSARRIDQPEYRVSSLPPGLRFDADKGVITGVPRHAGFYSVTVGVREEVVGGMHWNTVHTAWHTEEFEIAIYNPVEGGGDPVGPVADAEE